MDKILLAFKVLEEDEWVPAGWHKVTDHLIWDMRMNFTWKVRKVLDGHKTHILAGVVSRESVRITFTYAALSGLDGCAGEIHNAYLQAPSSQWDYIICSPEFCLEIVGRVAFIHRALCGGKSAGKDFRNHLRS